MNQTKFNTTTDQEEWQPPCLIVHGNSVDILILLIYIIFTALAIITSNALLLHRLLKKKQKTRADKMFIILSCSDIAVGLFSLPVISLKLFSCAANVFVAVFSSYALWNFAAYFPFIFSWTLIIIIALDRVFVITKAQVYKKCCTMKVLYWVITLCLLLTFVMLTLAIKELQRNGRNSHMTCYIILLFEFCLIFITIMVYAYLFHFVRSKSRVIENKRHCGTNFNKKLMITITYTYICLLFFTFPHSVGVAIYFFVRIRDQRMLGNLMYWGIILTYSNSYANAFIILYRSRGNHKPVTENKNEQQESLEERKLS